MNKITIKYRYQIPRLDDMLDKLYGSGIFSKIDLRMGTIKFVLNQVMSGKQISKIKFGLFERLVTRLV